jgi:plastocyanin
MRRISASIALTAVAAASLLVGCSSSSNGSSSGGGGGTTAAPTVTTGGASTSGAPAPATGAGAVEIKDFAFNPGDVTVKAGTEVTWTNNDSTTHRIKSDNGAFNSDDLGNGATFKHTFATAGTFAYICGIHPSMKGTVTVTS